MLSIETATCTGAQPSYVAPHLLRAECECGQVLENFNEQAMDGDKVEAIDFVVEHFEGLTRRLHAHGSMYAKLY